MTANHIAAAPIFARGLRSVLLAGAGALLAPSAFAATIAGLVGGDTLVLIDGETGAITGTVAITGVAGVAGVDAVVGIDVRPADGMLYGIAPDGTVVTIDPGTGAATAGVRLETMLPEGVVATVDFNPAADRLRLMGSDGTNLRANVDDGSVVIDRDLAFAADDMHAGETPDVVAGAYTNFHAGTETTTLYDLDGTLRVLLLQAPPNDGVLSAVGPLGAVADGPLAFDILSDGMGGNSAWLVAGGMLYEIDLDTGAATPAVAIQGAPGPITDIAILPAM